jgi:UPF0716 family protein affecting phage T7 exclusion
MSTGLMLVIAAVFVITIGFGLLIIRQFGSFEKKAMKAKIKQEEHIQKYLAAKAEEERKKREEAEREAELAGEFEINRENSAKGSKATE